jgi:glycine dehydrogenase
VHRIAALLAAGVKQLGFTTVNDTFFDTLTIDAGARTAQLHAFANAKRINLRRVSDTQVGVSVDETTTRDDLADLLAVFAQAAGGTAPDVDALDAGLPGVAALPAGLERTSAYLTHPCSTATIPKPRCCATCAACRTRTSRSTAR